MTAQLKDHKSRRIEKEELSPPPCFPTPAIGTRYHSEEVASLSAAPSGISGRSEWNFLSPPLQWNMDESVHDDDFQIPGVDTVHEGDLQFPDVDSANDGGGEHSQIQDIEWGGYMILPIQHLFDVIGDNMVCRVCAEQTPSLSTYVEFRAVTYGIAKEIIYSAMPKSNTASRIKHTPGTSVQLGVRHRLVKRVQAGFRWRYSQSITGSWLQCNIWDWLVFRVLKLCLHFLVIRKIGGVVSRNTSPYFTIHYYNYTVSSRGCYNC